VIRSRRGEIGRTAGLRGAEVPVVMLGD